MTTLICKKCNIEQDRPEPLGLAAQTCKMSGCGGRTILAGQDEMMKQARADYKKLNKKTQARVDEFLARSKGG